MARTVAVTGATGFIGRALIARLVMSGWKVYALARCVPLQEKNPFVEWISGNLGCRDALQNLVAGAEAVIHCAGAIRGKSWSEFYQTNVIGTKNILQAASNAVSCSRFLHISSLAAREPILSWYARSKFEAEEQIPRFSGQLESVIYRPAAVYGPGDKAMLPFFQSMRYGVLPVPGDPGNRFGLIHVDDLVAAICCWLEKTRASGGTYAIDDGTGGYNFKSIAMIAQQILGRPVRCFQIPAGSMRMLAHFNLWLAQFLNYSPILTPGKVRELQHSDWTCDISSLRATLTDWYPVIKLEDALPSLVAT